jgi:hypothetical protein
VRLAVGGQNDLLVVLVQRVFDGDPACVEARGPVLGRQRGPGAGGSPSIAY